MRLTRQRRRQGEHPIRLLVNDYEVDFLLARGYPLKRTSWAISYVRPFPYSAQYVMLSPTDSPLKSSFVRLPSRSAAPPGGPDWIHELKHDGFRIMARRDARAVRLFSRNGYNFGDRFPLIAKAIQALPVRSCIIDGEAIVFDSRGVSVFDLLRYRQHDRAAALCAFDLIELDGRDLRKAPIERRKDLLAKIMRPCAVHIPAFR
jgi:ATP-dependent DNA ligase